MHPQSRNIGNQESMSVDVNFTTGYNIYPHEARHLNYSKENDILSKFLHLSGICTCSNLVPLTVNETEYRHPLVSQKYSHLSDRHILSQLSTWLTWMGLPTVFSQGEAM